MERRESSSGGQGKGEKRSNSEDDWEDTGTAEEMSPLPKSHSEPVPGRCGASKQRLPSPDNILHKISLRNVKTIVHELKRQSAFDKVLGNTSSASVAQQRGLRSRTKSKKIVNIRDLPLPPENDKADDQSDYDPEAESPSASAEDESDSDDVETACTETDAETETGSTAPNTPMVTPIHEQSQTIVTRARDQGATKPMHELILASEKVLGLIDPHDSVDYSACYSNDAYADLMSLDLPLTGKNLLHETAETAKFQVPMVEVTPAEPETTTDPQPLVIAEDPGLSPSRPQPSAAAEKPYNTFLQVSTPQDATDSIWKEFISELQFLDEEVLKQTVDDQDVETVDPSFNFLAEQEKERQRTDLHEIYHEETRNYRILNKEVQELQMDAVKIQMEKTQRETLGDKFIADLLEESGITSTPVKCVSPVAVPEEQFCKGMKRVASPGKGGFLPKVSMEYADGGVSEVRERQQMRSSSPKNQGSCQPRKMSGQFIAPQPLPPNDLFNDSSSTVHSQSTLNQPKDSGELVIQYDPSMPGFEKIIEHAMKKAQQGNLKVRVEPLSPKPAPIPAAPVISPSSSLTPTRFTGLSTSQIIQALTPPAGSLRINSAHPLLPQMITAPLSVPVSIPTLAPMTSIGPPVSLFPPISSTLTSFSTANPLIQPVPPLPAIKLEIPTAPLAVRKSTTRKRALALGKIPRKTGRKSAGKGPLFSPTQMLTLQNQISQHVQLLCQTASQRMELDLDQCAPEKLASFVRCFSNFKFINTSTPQTTPTILEKTSSDLDVDVETTSDDDDGNKSLNKRQRKTLKQNNKSLYERLTGKTAPPEPKDLEPKRRRRHPSGKSNVTKPPAPLITQIRRSTEYLESIAEIEEVGDLWRYEDAQANLIPATRKLTNRRSLFFPREFMRFAITVGGDTVFPWTQLIMSNGPKWIGDYRTARRTFLNPTLPETNLLYYVFQCFHRRKTKFVLSREILLEMVDHLFPCHTPNSMKKHLEILGILVDKPIPNYIQQQNHRPQEVTWISSQRSKHPSWWRTHKKVIDLDDQLAVEPGSQVIRSGRGFRVVSTVNSTEKLIESSSTEIVNSDEVRRNVGNFGGKKRTLPNNSATVIDLTDDGPARPKVRKITAKLSKAFQSKCISSVRVLKVQPVHLEKTRPGRDSKVAPSDTKQLNYSPVAGTEPFNAELDLGLTLSESESNSRDNDTKENSRSERSSGNSTPSAAVSINSGSIPITSDSSHQPTSSSTTRPFIRCYQTEAITCDFTCLTFLKKFIAYAPIAAEAMFSLEQFNENSQARRTHCAELVNQIANIANEIRVFPDKKLSSDDKPVALGSDKFTWVKRRPATERNKNWNEDFKRLQNYWMKGTAVQINEAEEKKRKSSRSTKNSNSPTAGAASPKSGKQPGSFQMCGSMIDLDPKRSEKDEAIGMHFRRKLDVAFSNSDPESLTNCNRLIAAFAKSTTATDVQENYNKIKGIFNQLNRHDLLDDFVMLINCSQAVHCGLTKEFYQCQKMRELYVLLELFYEKEVDEDDGKTPIEVPLQAKVEDDPKKKKATRKKQKMKTFSEFIAKVIVLLEELEATPADTRAYLNVTRKVRTKMLGLLKGKPLLHRMVATHLFQEYSADMFEPETCIWMDDPAGRSAVHSQLQQMIYFPSKQAVETMNVNKRLPTGFSEISKNSEVHLPLASEPLLTNKSQVLGELNKRVKQHQQQQNAAKRAASRATPPASKLAASVTINSSTISNNGLNRVQAAREHRGSAEKEGSSPKRVKVEQVVIINENAMDVRLGGDVEMMADGATGRKERGDGVPADGNSRASLGSSNSSSSKIEGLIPTELALQKISEEAPKQTDGSIWTEEDHESLLDKWDDFDFMSHLEAAGEDADDNEIIIEFCKNLENSLCRSWPDIKARLDTHIQSQMSGQDDGSVDDDEPEETPETQSNPINTIKSE